MPPTPVRITVLSDDASPVPVVGVVIDFYDTGGVFQTEGTTDSNGQVFVSLPDASYDLLFFQRGTSILPKQPQRIVVDHLLINHFQVTAHVRTMTESMDPALCRISGYLLGPGGQPVTDQRLVFNVQADVLIAYGTLVSPNSFMRVQPDSTGFFQFDLLRNVTYSAFFELLDTAVLGQSPYKAVVLVPNLPSMDLTDILFPLPINSVFSAPTINLLLANQANPDTSITLTTTYSDASVRTQPVAPPASLSLSVSDPTIVSASLSPDGTTISLSPLKVGVATITVTRVINTQAVWLPAPPAFSSGSLAVTVA